MNDWIWHPIIFWPWLALVATLLLAGIGWSLWHGIRSKKRAIGLGILRILMLGLLLIMLFQPQQQQDEITILHPQLAVLIDSSESMNDPVDVKQPLRSQRIHEWIQSKAMTEAQADFDLHLFNFDQTLGEQQPDLEKLKFTGRASRIVEALNQLQERFRGQPLAGILLLSDGLETGDSANRPNLSNTVPVNTFELEKPFVKKKAAKKISLTSVDHPPRVVLGWDAEIRVTVAGTNMNGETVPVELWREGHKQAEMQIAFNEDNQTRQVAFPITANKPGSVSYEIRVNHSAADQEAHSYPFLIEVMAQWNRVIYVQNHLGFDFKYLRKAIASNRNLQLNAFARWADGRLVSFDDTQGQTGASDFTPQSLANAAVLILGDLPPDSLSAAQIKAILDFVNHGGGLILLGGPNLFTSTALSNTALAPLLPIQLPAPYLEGSFPVQITETGLHHPVFGSLFTKVKDFPPLLTCNTATGIKPNSELLLQTLTKNGPQPLVVAMRFGQGRVVTILTDTLWRWRLAANGWTAERSPHDLFWTQLLDWLIPKEQDKQNHTQLDLFTERTHYILGEHPEVRAILHDPTQPATLPLKIKGPDGKLFDYTLKPAKLQTHDGESINGYRAEIEANLPGLFQAKSTFKINGTDISSETRFLIDPPTTEITGKPIDRAFLKQIAQSTGGKFYPIGSWDSWRTDLHFKEQHFSRIKRIDLWNHPLLVGLFIGLLIIEWILRKLWNLP